jgi:undecaprenyl-phosphate 4-deoxy-4-formamido-L-arabinose transferase
MSGLTHSLSVVVPVYCGADTLPELLRRLAGVLPGLADQYEVVLVNDASPDDSWQVILSLCQQYSWLRGINLMRNYGQHNATLCGVRAAQFEVIVTMDDDLQHPPEQIHLLLKKLHQGFDVVYGLPQRPPHSWWRNWFSLFTKRVLANVMGIPTIQDIGAFRALRTRLRFAFTKFCGSDVLLDVLLSWGTKRFAAVVVQQDERVIGQSNYSFWKLARVALLILTGFSTLPLRLASLLGFAFTLFGVGVFVYVVVVYLTLGSVEGFPFLASIISLFSGMQLFALGIIGEYLSRMFDRSMDRPTYTILERTDHSGSEPACHD